ncbi:hypothetical protein P9112_002213 [Eukaryota sp. TZLM1-RC]
MSVLFSQNTDTVKTNMQKHNRYAISIPTAVVGEVEETSKSRTRARDHPPPLLKEKRWKQARNHLPPLPNQNNGNRHGTTSRLFQIQPNATKGFSNGTTPLLTKNANVGSSPETSTVLQGYEKLQSILDELDDEEKELRQQIVKDAEAYLELTDYSLFEQLPSLWKQISKTER